MGSVYIIFSINFIIIHYCDKYYGYGESKEGGLDFGSE